MFSKVHELTYSIDVGVWVLGLSVLGQNTWSNLVNLADQLVHLVILAVFLTVISTYLLGKKKNFYLGKFSLGHVTGISLAENSMSIPWNNLTGLERGPEVVLDGLITEIIANSSLHLGEPVQDFLVGETVERTSKTIETSGEGEHGRAESTADQVRSVGTDVTTLVISVDGKVQSHQLNEIVVVTETQLVGEVEAVILVILNRCDLASLEDVLVDPGSNGWELGNQIHGILESVLPVLGLLHSLGICLCKGRFVLEGIDCDGELCHWMQVIWAAVDKLFDEFGDFGASGPLCGEVADLLLAGNFASQEKPEETWGLN
jgi:hypothetical protein